MKWIPAKDRKVNDFDTCYVKHVKNLNQKGSGYFNGGNFVFHYFNVTVKDFENLLIVDESPNEEEGWIPQLKKLLGKLQSELGHKCCIIPAYIADGIHLGIYDENGEIKNSTTAADLKTAISDIQKAINNK